MPQYDMKCERCGRVREEVPQMPVLDRGDKVELDEPCRCGCRVFMRADRVHLIADMSAHWSDECRGNGGRIPPGWSKRKDPE